MSLEFVVLDRMGAISICDPRPNGCRHFMAELFPLELSVEETKRLLDEKPGEVLLIDVRELSEVETCRIAGAEHIPMRQIPEQLGSLPKDKHLLIHCHHGGRSMRVTQYLRANGYEAVSNVAGGIDAWSLVIDPTVPRY
jgi:rhodanese-related sulfurtransferase